MVPSVISRLRARALGIDVRRHLAAVRTHARSWFPLSITARLALSFVAVTVLAATANLIAQKSVSVIRFALRPETVTASAPPAIVLPPLPEPAAPPPIVKPVESVKVPIVDRKQVDALTIQIDLLERAGESRAAANTAENDEQFRSASRSLRHTAGVFGHGGGGVAPAAAAVTRHANEYADGAAELVSAADERRAVRLDYAQRSEAIGSRIQNSLDAAWKIFGRVIARQSLVQLRADLDALTHNAAGLNAGEVLSAAQLTPIVDREHAFEKTLAANRAGFVKAEGLAWVQGMDDDFAALVDLRQRIGTLNARYETAHSEFSRQHVSLSDALLTASTTFKTVAGRASAAALADAAPVPSSPAVTPLQSTAPAPPASPLLAAQNAASTQGIASAPPDSTVAGDVVTETRGVDRSSRHVMGIVTAVVMLIIFVISLVTVRSVLKPVRNMIKATSRLAAGQSQVEVARGGIRELDALAGTFNDMAAKLAAAQHANRSHQENLESKVLERTHQLQQLAQQDPLTSLPNRRHLTALLNATLDHAAKGGRHVGVYFIDVDNFKNFNDSLGHVFGDRVLMSVANRLEEVCVGFGYVARLGGDEFTVVYEDAESVEVIHEMGAELVQAFHSLVTVDDRDLRISVSVGASIYPEHERDAEGLLRAADSALFHAKELGRNQSAVFTPELTESAAARFTTEQGLRRALERGELELVYQPEVNLATLEVELVEALLRWRTPDGTMVPPGQFLPVAEQTGLIAEINAWVLRTAVTSAARWHSGGWPQARIAVNISSRQLLDHGFMEQLQSLLDEFQLPRRCVELELTETVLQTGPRTVAALRALHERGFGIALDDFGTGYSSLTSLERLPLSRIKMDKSLMDGVDSSPRAAAIVRAILDLCAGLGLAVTAEGIERPEQLAWLAANRNLFVQGFLLSKGIPFEEVLPARARLTALVQDLLLSTPPVAQHSTPSPQDSVSPRQEPRSASGA